MVATLPSQQAALTKSETIAYVGANASRFNVDPAAMLAIAESEGLGRAPGSGLPISWTLPNEGGSINFGPPSWNSGWAGHPAAGTPIVAAHGSDAPYWAWTPAGLDYWMQQISTVAGGLRNAAAINAIVDNFERPAAINAGPEKQRAINNYPNWQRQIQTALTDPGNTIVPVPSSGGEFTLDPGQTQLPVTSDPQAKAQPTAQTAGSPFSVKLFDTPFGPVNFDLPWDPSGVILFLAALFAIIIGAMLWDKSRNVIVKGGETAAVAAAV